MIFVNNGFTSNTILFAKDQATSEEAFTAQNKLYIITIWFFFSYGNDQLCRLWPKTKSDTTCMCFGEFSPDYRHCLTLLKEKKVHYYTINSGKFDQNFEHVVCELKWGFWAHKKIISNVFARCRRRISH
jgi:hypothetical protein